MNIWDIALPKNESYETPQSNIWDIVNLETNIPEKSKPEERTVGKQIANIGTAVGEELLGRPGALRETGKFVANLGVKGAEKLTGKEFPEVKEFIQKGPIEGAYKNPEQTKLLRESIRSTRLPDEPFSLETEFPEPSRIREEITKPLLGEDVEPEEDSWEKTFENVARGITNMFGPGAGSKNLRLTTKIAAPIVGESAKETAKKAGLSKESQAYANIGAQVLFSMSNQINAGQHTQRLMQQAENSIPAGTNINMRPTERAFQNIKNQSWYRGSHNIAEKKPAIQMIEDIQKRIQNGHMDAQQALQLRHDINKMRNNLGAFGVEPSGKESAIRYLDEVYDALNDSFERYGINYNPQFRKLDQPARQAYAVTARSGAIANWIQKHYTKPIIADSTKILFGFSLPHAVSLSPMAAAAGSTAYLANQSTRVYNQVTKSPLMRKYYTNAIKASVNGNKAEMIANISKLDAELKKKEHLEKFFYPPKKIENQKSSSS